MELLVNDALLGKLMVKLLLSGDLKLSIHFLALVIVVLVVVIVELVLLLLFVSGRSNKIVLSFCDHISVLVSYFIMTSLVSDR